MKVLLTGAFGNVGISTLEELIKRNYEVRIFDISTPKNRQIAKKYQKKAQIIWGDIRNYDEVEKAVEGSDAVIHAAAIIPPLADKNPVLAEAVNVNGTKNIISAIQKQANHQKLVYTSSVAVYGDRLKLPYIRTTDIPNPNPHDEYAKQKLKAEKLIKESGIDYVIFRLTYIVSSNKLDMDPLMFEMPLETYIETCDTKDVGFALANSLENKEVWGLTLHLAGGEECRTTYKEYLNKMLLLFGLGKKFLPDEAFAKSGFHCGYMDTDESQKALQFQQHTLGDYFKEVKKEPKTGAGRFFLPWMPLIKLALRDYLLKKSPYYKKKQKIFT